MSFQPMSSQIDPGNGFGRDEYRYYSGVSSEQPGVSQYVYHQTIPDVESYCSPENLDHQVYSDISSQGTNFPVQTEHYCTLESSSITGGYNSPSTLSLSSNGSPMSNQGSHSHSPESCTLGSPMSVSCITNNQNDLQFMIKELESAVLVTDEMEEQQKWRQVMDTISGGDLSQALVFCAKFIADDDLTVAHKLIAELRKMVSVTGEPMQRLGAYLLEGLVARLSSSGSSIYKSLKCSEPTSSELLSYMHLLYEVCPFFKFGYMSANGAIAEAMKDENRIHIIDFQIAQGSQWVSLLQALGSRPGGAPYVRITGMDDSQSAYARGGGLNIVGQRLTKMAHMYNVPFEFNASAMSGSQVGLENLGIRPWEAIAVNFPFMLHHMPDESVSTDNHRDRLLRLVKSFSPKVVTLVEQESNTNTAPFYQRFRETLSYYTSMFESIDVTLPREHKERINVEQHCLARDIVNIIACEGAERVERHELLGKWKSRFTMAGFSPYPLSSVVNSTIKSLLEKYCEHYKLEERNGCLYLGWKNRDLVAACAWK